METAKLKKFAQFARRSLMEQVSGKLKLVLAKESEARRENVEAVRQLEAQIAETGQIQVVEKVAYIWFNRFCALRFMDVNRYTRIGVVSAAAGQFQPEILAEAKMGHIDEEMVSDNTRQQIFALLDGKAPSRDPQGEAYRLLVVAACNSWYRPMPFLFERIADYTELLLPDDLLSGNSILAYTREALTPDVCRDVEVLGWLYQFYISERKDQVMARKSAVPTEDIPAVTQLFTPHWIVRYLVENSLGRLWLLNRPGSRLREHMPYYIEGEAEADFLKITKPEEIRMLDPAVGSGHMLTYAFDLLFLIYEEEGYPPSEIPGLILRHNLYGLEICPRAAQLAELALVFKARAKSRRFFQPEHLVRANIIELRDVRFAENELHNYSHTLGLDDLFDQPMLKLLHQFEEAKNFGALIQPCLDEQAIIFARRVIEAKDLGDQLFLRTTHLKVLRVLEQAEALTQRYHVVVANPPYMGSRQMNRQLRIFADENFPNSKSDLLAMFVERNLELAKGHGFIAMITMHSWMFLSAYDELRSDLLNSSSLVTLAHLGPRAFDSISGEVVQTAAFCIKKISSQTQAICFRLVDGSNEAEKERALLRHENRFLITNSDIRKLPRNVFAYWLDEKLRHVFKLKKFGDISDGEGKNVTADNARFLRLIWEVESIKIGRGKKWLLYAKGGANRKWAGNLEHVVDWSESSRQFYRKNHASRIIEESYWYRPGITWSVIGGSGTGFRHLPEDTTFDTKGLALFTKDKTKVFEALGLMNSIITGVILPTLNPTMCINTVDVKSIPVPNALPECSECVNELVGIARADWDNFETSWDFRDQPLLRPGLKGATLAASWQNWEVQSSAAIHRMQELETENNRLFIAAYGLDGELSPEVPKEQITLARAEVRRDMAAFLSYAVGCMMGRYSLDHPGLILANAGDTLREFLVKVGRPQDQLTFTPDEDGVIPILDGDWFPDDITERFKKFLKVTFGEEHFAENIQFIEASLGKDIRKYFLTDFYKNHIQTYKKRPIYWLFSSPKGSFNALIYLHRYRPDTVSVVLNGYLREFRTKLTSHRENQEQISISSSASPGEKTKAIKKIEQVKKMIAELEDYERDVLYPLAIKQVAIDLDDGVKVNYPKFGAALKKIPGLDAKEE